MKRKLLLTVLFFCASFVLATGYRAVIESATAKDVASGDALIGGAFTLVNQDGATVTDQDFRGKLMLVFFGFTNCPDVCPTGLMTISKVMEGLGADADKLTPIFITVDSETDKPEHIKEFLKNFNPAIQGLTGTEEQLKAAQDAYKVYAKKIENTGMMGTMFNHSSFVYLMDKEGKYITHFQHKDEPQKMIEEIRKHL